MNHGACAALVASTWGASRCKVTPLFCTFAPCWKSMTWAGICWPTQWHPGRAGEDRVGRRDCDHPGHRCTVVDCKTVLIYSAATSSANVHDSEVLPACGMVARREGRRVPQSGTNDTQEADKLQHDVHRIIIKVPFFVMELV